MSQLPDLSHLPAPVQAKVQQMLAQIPEPMRKQALQAGAPLLQKVIERAQKEVMQGQGKAAKAARVAIQAGQAAASHSGPHHVNSPVAKIARPAPHGHYNATIMPGDKMSLRGMFFFIVIISMAVAWFVQ
jgi:hypothetical protein